MALFPSKEEIEATKQQILRIFRPDGQLLAAQVSIRLEEKTGGRKVLKDSKVINFLNDLVKEERLLKKEEEQTIRGHKVNAVLYFLPRV